MTAFGQPTLKTPQLESYTDDKLFNFRLSLIKEEFKEIKEAIKNKHEKRRVIHDLRILYGQKNCP